LSLTAGKVASVNVKGITICVAHPQIKGNMIDNNVSDEAQRQYADDIQPTQLGPE
jgi:hypothetical protein